ncbi:hypothetical protein [Paenibacillus aestuarii]|uniref:Uncharacterized protein n=1 Tax=Paenibacillus aestuarii TaxID=516965 RepID=A0ABW0KB38_9BACL|nr:hypothetical protein [Paenibacillus aestuarii]
MIFLVITKDVGKAIFQNALTCFIQETENKIRSGSTDELQMKWIEIKNHITLDDEASRNMAPVNWN